MSSPFIPNWVWIVSLGVQTAFVRVCVRVRPFSAVSFSAQPNATLTRFARQGGIRLSGNGDQEEEAEGELCILKTLSTVAILTLVGSFPPERQPPQKKHSHE